MTFTESLTGLSADPVLRSMQVALAAIDEHISIPGQPVSDGMREAYAVLCAAIPLAQDRVVEE